MEYLLGIDIGTGSTKAVALNLQYKPIETAQQYYPTENSKPGFSEQDPELIWAAFVNCVKEISEKLGPKVLSIGLSSAMHSLICVDALGNALAPMLTWADARSAQIAEELKASDKGISIYKSTGTPIHAMSPLCKIMWMKQHEPELFNNSHKFISIKEYIWFKLFGEFKIDHSIASCTGLFNIEKLTWDETALEVAGIDQSKLAEPVPTDYSQPISNHNPFGLPSSTLVIGASDGCLANLGTEATQTGVAAITIGTSGALRLASHKPVFNPEAMPFSYILDQNIYICGGPINNGGVALQWLIKNVFGKSVPSSADYEQVFEQVENTIAGSENLFFLPYLTGERAPIWDSKSCGTFFGLNLNHEQKHFSRAVIEGICFALNDVLKAIEDTSSVINQLNVSGGFVHSKIWMRILADVTGKKIVLIQEEDASAVGAAYLAAKATGLSDDYPVSTIKNPKIILPEATSHLLYQKKFLIFKQLYANLKTTMHQISSLS
jgi:gluconokinase